jgi:predicted RNA-binding Zn-ribbon protein involved in translation (DUF1610 family)
MLACSNCGATGVRIDLDVRATPPEHVCLKCKRMPKCDECGKRRNRLTIEGSKKICGPCIRRNAKLLAESYMRTCTACPARVDVSDTNDHGECPSCSSDRLYRENPITRRAS